MAEDAVTARRAPTGLASAGKALWRRILGDVPAGWDLDERDLRWLEQACRCADDAAALERSIAKAGRVVAGSKGQPRAHPALDVLIRLRTLEAGLLKRIELNPPAAKTPAQLRAAKAASTRHTALTSRDA